MIKYALCTGARFLPQAWQDSTHPELIEIPPGFFDTLQTWVVDRALCETDPTCQQLLPYIVLANAEDPDHIFTYSRAKSGAEDRLHGKLSIGVGGHVDEEVPAGASLLGWLQAEAARELQEEVGLFVHPSAIQFKHFIVDRGSEVGSVHLGLYAKLLVDISTLQPNVAEDIEQPQFVNHRTAPPEHVARLENRSRIIHEHHYGAAW